jgi:XTP/dITP diphosphohydrolase
MRTFGLGTANPGKIREYATILQQMGCAYEPISGLDPEETEDDFEGNAILKARAYAAHCGKWTLAEDSGLVIPSLGNLPGPWSARFSDCELDESNWKIVRYQPSNLPKETIQQRNLERVLHLLRDASDEERAAAFVVVLVVATPSGEIKFQTKAEVHGSIARKMQGKQGFGYDPLFLGTDTQGRTYAELSPEEKNARSHRQRALVSFRTWLESNLALNDCFLIQRQLDAPYKTARW